MSGKKSEKGYEIGYGKPPKASRFRKGASSPNQRGRPRKPTTEAESLVAILNEVHEVTLGGKRVKMSALEISQRALAGGAMSGDARAYGKLVAEMKRLGVSYDTPGPREVHVTVEYVDAKPQRVGHTWEDVEDT